MKVCGRSQKDGPACCIQCLERCCCFKFFVPREHAAMLKWSVTGSSWCNGGDAADALLIGAYQVFLGKTPEAFVQPSANRGAVSSEDYKKTRVSFQQQSSLPKDDRKSGPCVLPLASLIHWFYLLDFCSRCLYSLQKLFDIIFKVLETQTYCVTQSVFIGYPASYLLLVLLPFSNQHLL